MLDIVFLVSQCYRRCTCIFSTTSCYHCAFFGIDMTAVSKSFLYSNVTPCHHYQVQSTCQNWMIVQWKTSMKISILEVLRFGANGIWLSVKLFKVSCSQWAASLVMGKQGFLLFKVHVTKIPVVLSLMRTGVILTLFFSLSRHPALHIRSPYQREPCKGTARQD